MTLVDEWELISDKVNIGGESWGFLFKRTRTYTGLDFDVKLKPQIQYFVFSRIVNWIEPTKGDKNIEY